MLKPIKGPIFKSADPEFNYEAAQKTYDLIMKMDQAEAYTFSLYLVNDLHQTTIRKNLRTLQTHLDEVVAKRIAKAKGAINKVWISKRQAGEEFNEDEALAAAGALTLIEKAGRNPYDYGYMFDETDFRRNARGQFTTKIKQPKKSNKLGVPQAMDPKTASAMGIPDRKALGREARGQYQAEYLQIAQALGAFADSRNMLEIENKATGTRRLVENKRGTTPDAQAWNPKTERVTAVHSTPEGLRAGGAAFGITSALGGSAATGQKTQRSVEGADRGLGSFSEDWNRTTDGRNSNERLYNRVNAGSKLLGEIAPWSPKAQLAAQVGQFVGSHGAEAEAVVGPTARKLAYRYRGTERTPDQKLLREYNIVADRSRKASGNDGPLDEAKTKQLRSRQASAIRAAHKAKAAREGKPLQAVPMTRDEKARVLRNVEAQFRKENPVRSAPQDMDAARAAVAEYLVDRLPDRTRYNLQLDSGHLPPSEGVLIDRNGEIVAQAVGYSDDHYLPFNLKNLKALKGGSYVRNRMMGGPTSEDIYTGLVGGATALTVVSNSGTFTLEFADDFTGLRRYNDKAARMTDRYEKLLDSVQSEQVDRATAQLDANTESAIRAKVESELGPYASPSEKRKGFNDAIKAYTSDPGLTDIDDQIIELTIRHNEAQAGKMSAAERNRAIKTLENERLAMKEFKYRLNGEGYKDALLALKEQFPYYIKDVRVVPTKDTERKELGRDKGYVEPGRNRPTAARAGLHGTTTNPGEKFSASQTNYQGARGKLKAVPQEASAKPSEAKEGEKPKPQSDRERAAESAKQRDYRSKITEVYTKVKANSELPDTFKDMTPEQFSERIVRDANFRDQFENLINSPANKKALLESGALKETDYGSLEVTRGAVSSKWSKDSNLLVPKQPYKFDGPAYGDQATAEQAKTEYKRLASKMAKPRTGDWESKTDDQLKSELDYLVRLRSDVHDVRGEYDEHGAQMVALGSSGDAHKALASQALRHPEFLDEHIEHVHRIRALRTKIGDPGAQTVHVQAPPEKAVKQGDDKRADLIRLVEDAAKAAMDVGDDDAADDFSTWLASAAAGNGGPAEQEDLKLLVTRYERHWKKAAEKRYAGGKS